MAEKIEHSGWYRSIPVSDRIALDAVARWLRPVPWQLFVTLTFPWNVREETAEQKFHVLVDRLERGVRTSVCFVAGKERKADASEARRIPWHYHVLMTSLTSLDPSVIADIWHTLVGRSATDGNAQPASDLVRIKSYVAELGGIEYCLKSMNDCQGDWTFRHLEHFHPRLPGSSRPGHKTIRAGRRFEQQSNRYSRQQG
jgi:hypothetical protein